MTQPGEATDGKVIQTPKRRTPPEGGVSRVLTLPVALCVQFGLPLPSPMHATQPDDAHAEQSEAGGFGDRRDAKPHIAIGGYPIYKTRATGVLINCVIIDTPSHILGIKNCCIYIFPTVRFTEVKS